MICSMYCTPNYNRLFLTEFGRFVAHLRQYALTPISEPLFDSSNGYQISVVKICPISRAAITSRLHREEGGSIPSLKIQFLLGGDGENKRSKIYQGK